MYKYTGELRFCSPYHILVSYYCLLSTRTHRFEPRLSRLAITTASSITILLIFR